MSKNLMPSSFEKVKILIDRNDLATAEKILKKCEDSSQKEKLQKEIIKRQKRKTKNTGANIKRLKSDAHHRNRVRLIKRLFVFCWFITGFILYPYGKTAYFTSLSNWDGPPFRANLIMEIVYFVHIFLMFLYFGVEFFMTHRDRKIWESARKIWESAMYGIKNEDKSSFDWVCAQEKKYINKERQCFLALMVFLILFIIWLAYMIKIFSS